MDYLQRVVIRTGVAIACLAVASANAQMSGAAPVVTQITGGVTLSYDGVAGSPPAAANRTITKNGGTGTTGFTITDSYAFLGPIGAVAAVPMTGAGATSFIAARAIGWGTVGGAVAGCVASVVCAAGAASVGLGALWLADHRMKKKREQYNSGPDGLLWDPGVDPVASSADRFCWVSGGCYVGPNTNQSAPWSSTAAQAASLAVSYQNAQAYLSSTTEYCANVAYSYQPSYSLKTPPPELGGAFVILRTTALPATPCRPGGHTVLADIPSNVALIAGVTVTQCPAVTALDPADNIAAGSPVGPDGKCPSGQYQDSDAEKAAYLANAYPPTDQAKIDAAFQAFNDWAHSGLPCPSCSPATATPTGPATVTAPPVTTSTTNSAGTVSTTNVDTHQMQYTPGTLGSNPAKIQWPTKTTETTTTTTPTGGSPTTTTTTTTVTTQNAAELAKAEAVTQCDKFPNSAGCAKLGDAPTSEELPTSTKTATFAPDPGWGADNGTCPAMVHTTLVGNVDPYALFCTYASGIRYVVLGFASIMGVLIFIGKLD